MTDVPSNLSQIVLYCCFSCSSFLNFKHSLMTLNKLRCVHFEVSLCFYFPPMLKHSFSFLNFCYIFDKLEFHFRYFPKIFYNVVRKSCLDSNIGRLWFIEVKIKLVKGCYLFLRWSDRPELEVVHTFVTIKEKGFIICVWIWDHQTFMALFSFLSSLEFRSN